jgi:periplasmic protein TonB
MNEQLEKPPIAETNDIVANSSQRQSTQRTATTSFVPEARSSGTPSRPSKQPTASRTAYDDNTEEDDTFIGRHRIKLTIGAILVIGAGIGYLMTQEKTNRPYKPPERVVSIMLPPPPSPPPPPRIQPPPEQKMIEQAPLEEKPPEPAPKPAEQPPELGTNIKGDGPGSIAGLGARGDGARIGGNGTGSGRGGGRWDGYARQVQSRISETLRTHSKTRSASIRSMQVRIWCDATGRITRVKLMSSTGDAALDAALQNEVFSGLQLREAPPQGMPSPIVLRIASRRPN